MYVYVYTHTHSYAHTRTHTDRTCVLGEGRSVVQVRLLAAPGGQAGGWPGILCEPVGPLALGWVRGNARPIAQPERRMSGGPVVFV